MQITKLFPSFDKLHELYGEKTLDAIYGCGQLQNPALCLVFMNPTARNVSASKKWKGLKAPWIGTKNVWEMFFQLGLLEKNVAEMIKTKKPVEWDNKFALDVYQKVAENKMYITNLSKATQLDARALPDVVFREYVDLFKEEIHLIQPKIIITFGNQVSSVLFGKNVKVGEYRKKHEVLNIKGIEYKIFPVYYPVGQGRRNIVMAKEDIAWILKNN